MRLFLTLGSLFLAAAPIAATAMPFDSDSFRDAKTGYHVEVNHDGETMLLDGYNPQSRGRFHLVVNRGIVSGVYEGRPVRYVVGHPPVDEVAANTAN